MVFSYKGKLFSERFRIVYLIRIWQRRIFTIILWQFSQVKFAKVISCQSLLFRSMMHSSKLTRMHDAANPQQIQWQINKIINLKLAASKINGIIIRPGETFSFCKLVGMPTKAKGYLEGMELSRGEARSGIGGGICQLANLINWMAWHTEMEVTKRSNHSFDPFPDRNRILPFGSGAAIFWNFVDLQIANNSKNSYQILISFTKEKLKGEIRTDFLSDLDYHIYQKNHKFTKIGEEYYRANEIWQTVSRKFSDGRKKEKIQDRLMVKNCAKVKYTTEEANPEEAN